MTTKILISFAAIAILGFALWVFIPMIVDVPVKEDLATYGKVISLTDLDSLDDLDEVLVPIARGEFRGLEGHQAQGTVTLYQKGEQYLIAFDDSFRVTNGPDLFVHLGRKGVYEKAARLSELKGSIGSQVYALPVTYRLEDQNEIWIWSRFLAVPYAKAILRPI